MHTIRLIVVFFIFFSNSIFANQVNLSSIDTWGDKSYGMMQADGDDLYVATDGILVLDLSTATSPVKKTKILLDDRERVKKLSKIGTVLYALTSRKFYFIDIQNADSPQIISRISPIGAGNYEDFIIKNNNLLLATTRSPYVELYDLTTTSNPTLRSSLSAGINTNVIALALTDNELVYASGGVIKLISLEDDNLLGEIYSDTQDFFNEVTVTPTSGDIVYFANAGDFIIYDFSDLTSISKNTVNATLNDLKDINIVDDEIHTLDSSGYLSTFDITNPLSPSLLSTSTASYSNNNLTNFGPYVINAGSSGLEILFNYSLGASYNESSYIYNLSSSETLFSASSRPSRLYDLIDGKIQPFYEVPNSSSYTVLELDGDYMYGGSSHVWDISDRENIFQTGSYSVDPGGQATYQLMLDGEELYSRSTARITKLSTLDPVNPVEISEIDTTAVTQGASIQSTALLKYQNHFFLGTVSGLYHYHENENDTYQVYDGVLGAEDWITALEEKDGYLYSINNSDTFEVWNINDPEVPVLEQTITLIATQAYASSIYKNWLFLHTDNDGIHVFDISQPSNPVFLEFFDFGFDSRKTDQISYSNHLLTSGGGQIHSFSINEAPTITTSQLVVDEDVELVETLEFVNLENDTLTFEIADEPGSGTVEIDQNGQITYQANQDYNGVDSFDIRIADNFGGDSVKTISITVNAVNDIPVVGDNAISTEEDVVLDSSINASDVDNNELVYLLVSDVASGQLTLNTDGTYSYVPNENFNGSDSFIFSVTDELSTPIEAEVSIEITAVNDAPSLTVSELTLDEDSEASSDAIASDIENSALTYSVSVSASNGAATIDSNGNYNYQPNTDFNGTDSFEITVNDGELSTAEVVEVTIAAINDAPTTSNYSGQATTAVQMNASLVGNDVDGDNLTFELENNVSNGTLNLAADGSFTYQSAAGFTGSVTFTFTVNDGEFNSETATATITVVAAPEESSGGGGSIASLSILLFLLLHIVKVNAKRN
jgi:VCBS repeat-containing protein